MASPKSAKLMAEMAREIKNRPDSSILDSLATEVQSFDGPIKIREIQCLNDFVAILLFRVQSGIQLPDAQQYRNEGIVIGVGHGIPDARGGRVATQLAIGDVVLFQDRNIVLDINSDNPPYKGQRVVIVSERSLICKLPPVPFEIVS